MSAPTQRAFSSPEAPKALGPYSPCIKVESGTVYLSGSLGIDPSTSLLEEGVEKQTRRGLQNMKATVESAELTMGHVVKTLVLLTDMSHFEQVNKIYEEFFPTQGTTPPPARSCFAVSSLPKGALFEIEGVAYSSSA
eukprot:GHVN01015525.1.p1 GENE.GHVN01015525.1~~GHVN01015525.1.p1  ORF type:complete len:137 (+),score=25.27 GHVN01015525.1:111-521(+)